MIPRQATAALLRLAGWYPAVAVTGPRQSGKTTLARAAFPGKPYVSLEDPDRQAFATEDARGFLAQFPDGAILDEVQRAPALFSWLQGLLDGSPASGRFVLTGSQQFALARGVSQSLAGRVGHLQLLPFSSAELAPVRPADASLEQVLLAGGYPPIFDRGIPPAVWFGDYVASYVERDLRSMLNVRDLAAFRRFVMMAAARTGQLLNLSALAADCGVTHNTAKQWLSILEASYLVTLVTPWHRNFGKRLVKTPKLYFLDTGLAAWLAGIRAPGELALGSLRGPLFETWIVSEVVKHRRNHLLDLGMHFWRDAHGHEVDLVIERPGAAPLAIECKAGQTVAADWFAPLERFAALTSGAELALLTGGSEEHRRGGVAVTGWRQIGTLLAALGG